MHYTVKFGTYARHEAVGDGQHGHMRIYNAGDEVELTTDEVLRLGSQVSPLLPPAEAVGTATSPAEPVPQGSGVPAASLPTAPATDGPLGPAAPLTQLNPAVTVVPSVPSQMPGTANTPSVGEQTGEANAHPIHGMNADEAHQLIASAPNVVALDALRTYEAANPKFPGGRLGVLRAIETRRSALA